MKLRHYQELAVNHAREFLLHAQPGQRQLYAAPTGTGKSIIELTLQDALPDSWIITPRVEIIQGMLDKRGIICNRAPEDIGLLHHITTPIRLRNAMMRGERTPPRYLIIDEGHHDSAQTYQDIHALCGYAPAVAYTATPYRGTPRSTAVFREAWGAPIWILTFAEAQTGGYLTMPRCSVLPLVDDDLIEVQNGELVASQVTAATSSRLGDLVSHCAQWRGWDMATMFACPGSEIARELTERLNATGLTAVCVLGTTSTADRDVCFRACVNRIAALVQVQVVSEGVDLPIRRLVDLSPCLSPVRWVQQFGRITRPTTDTPEYICTNRNLFRHAYTLNGAVPVADLLKAQSAFNIPATRNALRVVGLEALGRLKAVGLPLANGLTAIMYNVSTVEDNSVIDYCAIAHPNREDLFWARRESARVAGAERIWGRWVKCVAPDSLDGFNSIPPKPLSEKMESWWRRSARRVGLDPDATVNRKSFVALPILTDTGGRL